MRIYKTTNKLNGKIYIGKDVRCRPGYLGSGLLLKKAISKYGIENFINETIEECSTKEQLNEREVYWIKHFNATDRKIGYNIAIGGTGGDCVSNLNETAKKRMIDKRNQATEELRSSEEYRNRLSERQKDAWTKPGRRKNMQEKMLGRKITWSDKISASIKEWHKSHKVVFTEEMRKKVSDAMRGKELKKLSNEVEDKIVELYNTYGPKTMQPIVGVSQYIIIRVLKKRGVYKKWKKGKHRD